MFEFSNRRFLVVGSDLGSRGCLSWNCPEPITNNCAHQVSKVVYNKSAETGLQLAQPSLSLCKLLSLQTCKVQCSPVSARTELLQILSYVLYFSVWLLSYQFFCLPWPLSVFHTHKAPSFFSFIFRTQGQTRPFKLLAPPSQPQWQRANCRPVSAGLTPSSYELHRFFLYLMRTLMTMHSWYQRICAKMCWTCLMRLVRICINIVPTLYAMLVIMTHYFVRFRLRMWEMWSFQWFLSLKLQINLLKIGFERKIQLRTCSHLKVYHSIQVWFGFILDSSKLGYTLQTMSYFDFTLYCNMGSHLGQWHRPH
jgi:hypothetical protein